MKLIIAGGRDFEDLNLALTEFYDFSSEMNVNLSKSNPFKEIVSGGARGADRIGEKIAEINKIPVKQFIPDWNGLGKRAGFVRNADMGDYADAALIFWDGESKGSAHMIKLAQDKGLFVRVIRY